jgi:GNAT superfamily N-acetyltransferase
MLPTIFKGVTLRELSVQDSFEELTELLHLAYAPLAEQGLRYLATHQSTSKTKDRCDGATTIVGENNGKLVATVSYYPRDKTDGSPWLDRIDVASFGQFGVHPELQRLGIGSRLIECCEMLAIADGARHLALDTAESAGHLISYYNKKGFEVIEHVQWQCTNYRSVVMSKKLFPQ